MPASNSIARVSYTINEVAEMLGISPFTVRKMVNRNQLERLAVVDRVLITAESFRRLVRKGRVKAQA